jgi:hypothetical protein
MTNFVVNFFIQHIREIIAGHFKQPPLPKDVQ